MAKDSSTDQLSVSLGSNSLEVSAATVIGPHHLKSGQPNQDAYDLIATEGFLSLAVADGAGSLARSDEGSELAVEVAVGMAGDLILEAKRRGEEPDLEAILAGTILEARSALLSLDHWKEAGSTLVVALLTEHRFAVAALGDSFAVVQERSGKLTLVQPPAAGEFANITKLLSSEEATVSICAGELSGLSGLALCSDAFEHGTLEQRVPTAGFWSTVFSMAQGGRLKASDLISFMDDQGKISDDATLVALGASSEGGEAAQLPLLTGDYSLEELRALAHRVSDQSSADEDEAPRGIPRSF